MIFLTKEQRQRLQDASSGVYGDKRERLTDKQIEATAQKIDEVLLQLHQESPLAFGTIAHRDSKNKVVFEKMYGW
jgi:hypothetical protein